VYKFGDTEITVINGKHTDRYGVEIFTTSIGEEFDVTNKDRTLVDIAVRPAYCGGVKHVLEIFATAREQVSASKIFDSLEILDYLYPYHQKIGFYMERAGYSDDALRIMEQRPIEFDFYLDNAMGVDKKFDNRWRIFYPSALEKKV
jgi:predicted transcriptional regulator of viral defense system